MKRMGRVCGTIEEEVMEAIGLRDTGQEEVPGLFLKEVEDCLLSSFQAFEQFPQEGLLVLPDSFRLHVDLIIQRLQISVGGIREDSLFKINGHKTRYQDPVHRRGRIGMGKVKDDRPKRLPKFLFIFLM